MGDKTVIGTINVPKVVTVEDMDYILIGCFEGGSNYWALDVGVVDDGSDDKWHGESHASSVPGAGGIIEITTDPLSGTINNGRSEITYTDKTHWLVTKDKMLDGLKLYYQKWNKPSEIEDMDAYDYDGVLQYAIFGEQVYG
jgi:hypothetical protein